MTTNAVKYQRISNEDVFNMYKKHDIKKITNNHNDDLTDVEETDELIDEENNNITLLSQDNILGKSIATIRHEALVPISRPPTKSRDNIYSLLFLLHFVLVIILSFIDNQWQSNISLKLYSNAGGWASLMMIITLIGSFIGGVLIFIISNENYRKVLLVNGLTLSITYQICLGNILLLMQSTYSLIGLLLLFSAFIDSFRYKEAKATINFSCALIQLSIDIGKMYGINLFIACASIVVLQTCLLLWWGAFFVGVLSEVTSGTTSRYLIIVMSISFYWISQFFHAFMSFVTGGCILWYFLREDNEELYPTKRVLLLMQCAVTTSFGSLCKGSLCSPIAQMILVLNNWSHTRTNPATSCCSGKNFIRCLTSPFVNQAQMFNRLGFCLIATYGKTFCKSADQQAQHHPETIRIAIEDNTNYTLSATATFISGFITIFFSLLSDKNEGSSWPLFFLVNFYLAYTGVSLTLHTYRGAIDALIVAFAAKPERFAIENQIIFLRFLRYTESALR